MRLTYENLENVSMTKDGFFRKNITYFVYRDACKQCDEPYLAHKKKPSYYCCQSCAALCRTDEVKQKMSECHADVSGSNNPMYGKQLFDSQNGNYKGGYRKRGFAAFDSYVDKLAPIEKIRRHKDDSGVIR